MLLARFGGSSGKLYVDDVFSTYLYTGNGSTQTINNGIDLAGKGGLVHIKDRNSGTGVSHCLFHTARGAPNLLMTNTTGGQITNQTNSLTEFNSSGFTLGADNIGGNVNGGSYQNLVAWTFRNADRFYNHAVVNKSAGSSATVDFSNLGTLGMVRVKRTDTSGSWYVWHRGLSAGQLLIGESTAAAATLGHVNVSGTTVTLVNGVIADGTYLVEAWAHDTSPDGMIQCGSFTTDGGGNAAYNHGWPKGVQFCKIKASSGAGDWEMFDTARTPAWSSSDARLRANLSSAEDAVNRLSASGTSLNFTGLSANTTYVGVFIVAP